MSKKEFIRRLVEFLGPKGRWCKRNWRRKSWPREGKSAHQLKLVDEISDQLTRSEERKIRNYFKQGSECSSCGSLDIVEKVEYDEFPIIRCKCLECGDYWHYFLLYGRWGWYHDKGIHDSFLNKLASG